MSWRDAFTDQGDEPDTVTFTGFSTPQFEQAMADMHRHFGDDDAAGWGSDRYGDKRDDVYNTGFNDAYNSRDYAGSNPGSGDDYDQGYEAGVSDASPEVCEHGMPIGGRMGGCSQCFWNKED